LYDEHGFDPREVQSVEDLHRIPITSRQALQESADHDVVAAGTDPKRLIVRSTSGSTGRPLKIRRTWLEQNLLHLYRLRALESFGLSRRDRVLFIANHRPPHPSDSKLLGRTLTALKLYRERLDVRASEEPAAIARELMRFRPQVLSGTPNLLLLLSQALTPRQREAFRPRIILSGGEVLTAVQRARLEAEFGAPVRNVYSSFEFAVLAWECPATGAMHTNDDAMILEVLVDGRPAESGEAGEVVGTSLHAFAAPFIRYRQGDVATRGVTPCACGQAFATIAQVQGRQLDLLTLPDGRVLHADRVLALLVAGNAWLRHYQITQERIDRILIQVVPTSELSTETLALVHGKLRALVGEGVELEIRVVPNIPLEPNGKFRAVQSLLSAGSGAEPPGPATTVPVG
jgi:phenylacetate-CoA ligase